MDTFEAIQTRRSTRKFKDEPMDGEMLEKVIAAGRLAPCGGNSQSAHFITIRNRKILDELAGLVRETFAGMETTPGMYKSLQAAINASKKGSFVFHYNAPVLIVVANRIGYGNAMADCACAVENMMIAANALDLGSCYVNQLHWLDGSAAVREYMAKLGLGEDETICASLVMGKPDTADGLPIRTARNITGNKVDYID
jgi:nitroreductase